MSYATTWQVAYRYISGWGGSDGVRVYSSGLMELNGGQNSSQCSAKLEDAQMERLEALLGDVLELVDERKVDLRFANSCADAPVAILEIRLMEQSWYLQYPEVITCRGARVPDAISRLGDFLKEIENRLSARNECVGA